MLKTDYQNQFYIKIHLFHLKNYSFLREIKFDKNIIGESSVTFETQIKYIIVKLKLCLKRLFKSMHRDLTLWQSKWKLSALALASNPDFQLNFRKLT